MSAINIALFLHWYQPPIQKPDITLRVIRESYEPTVRGLERQKRGKITLNITGCLLEQLNVLGHGKLIGRIGRLVKSGRVELVGSSAYHAFLPGLPEWQIKRQIVLQEDIIHRYFGEAIKLRGFFSPEMAYVPRLARIVRRKKYAWMVLGIFGGPQSTVKAPLYIDALGLEYYFRERDASYALMVDDMHTSGEFIQMIRSSTRDKAYRVLAMDGETFGHHKPGRERLLEKLYADERIAWHTISDLKHLGLKKIRITPRKSSWTFLDAKRSMHEPFIRWHDAENEIHELQWKLTNLALKASHDEGSMRRLDQALFSCQYWWASARPWWQIEMIEAGAHELLQSIIESHATARYKQKAVDTYHEIVATAFEWMRSGKMQRRVNKEQEHMHMRPHQMRVNT